VVVERHQEDSRGKCVLELRVDHSCRSLSDVYLRQGISNGIYTATAFQAIYDSGRRS
jgi:hypothetical protein